MCWPLSIAIWTRECLKLLKLGKVPTFGMADLSLSVFI